MMKKYFFILFLFSTFLLASDLQYPLKNGSFVNIIKIEKSSDIGEDFDLALKSFSKAFENCSEGDLINHFGPNKDILGFYKDLLFKDDIKPFLEGKLIWLRAFLDNKLVGWISFAPSDKKPNACHVSTLAVDPLYQQLGIGKVLLKSLNRFSSDTQEIILQVRKINLNAIGFYKHLGFSEDLSLSRHKNSIWMSRSVS